MTEENQLKQLLQQALPPQTDTLEQDLWPRMLRRIDAERTSVPWFDWLLAGALLLLLAVSPNAIPILLYHL